MQKRAPSPLGVRLQETRSLGGLAARELDRLARTTEGHTSLIESGVAKNITVETAGKLASVLGVSLDWLVDGAGKAPTSRSVRAAIDVARGNADESGEHPAVHVTPSRTG